MNGKLVELLHDCCFILGIICSFFTLKFIIDDVFDFAFIASSLTIAFLTVGWLVWYISDIHRRMKRVINLDVAMINRTIKYWRDHKEKAEGEDNYDEVFTAACYIDAFQTMRVNHGLCLLPLEKNK